MNDKTNFLMGSLIGARGRSSQTNGEDVAVSINAAHQTARNGVRSRIAFRFTIDAANKITTGDRLHVSDRLLSETGRIYFIPANASTNGYVLSHKSDKSDSRLVVQITIEKDAYSGCEGRYRLHYDKEYSCYYIDTNQKL